MICLLQSMLHEDPQQRATVMEVFQMAGACRAFDHFQWRRVHKNAGPELDATVNFAWVSNGENSIASVIALTVPIRVVRCSALAWCLRLS